MAFNKTMIEEFGHSRAAAKLNRGDVRRNRSMHYKPPTADGDDDAGNGKQHQNAGACRRRAPAGE